MIPVLLGPMAGSRASVRGREEAVFHTRDGEPVRYELVVYRRNLPRDYWVENPVVDPATVTGLAEYVEHAAYVWANAPASDRREALAAWRARLGPFDDIIGPEGMRADFTFRLG